MNRFIDAEQALAELNQTPVVLKNFQGQDWELFAAMPAKPVFQILQLEASGHGLDVTTPAESLRMMSEMVPAEVFTAWIDGGMTTPQAITLMTSIIAVYNGTGASEEGAAEAPKKGRTPPSKTGAPPKAGK